MQTAIVVLIIVVAAFYVGRVFYKGFKQQGGCACTCCSSADTCSTSSAGNRSADDADRS